MNKNIAQRAKMSETNNNYSIRHTMRLACGIFLLTLLTIWCGGCVDLTGLPEDPVAGTISASHAAKYKYPGHVYAMRGFLGIFSTGMDTLAFTLSKEHLVEAAPVADEARGPLKDFLLKAEAEHRLNDGPLILVGHSWGADDQVRIARSLGHHGIKVDLLLLIDPVTPPHIPVNVVRCIDIYKSHPLTDWFPAWRGVPVTAVNPALTKLTNINLRTTPENFDTQDINHVYITASRGVQRMMRHAIYRACKRWEAEHPTGPWTAPKQPGEIPIPPKSD